MIPGALQKHFKRNPIVQIFAGMNLKAQIHSRMFKRIQNGTPARRQLFKAVSISPAGLCGHGYKYGQASARKT